MNSTERSAYLREIPGHRNYWVVVSGEIEAFEERCDVMLEQGDWITAGGIAIKESAIMQAFVRKNAHLIYARLGDIHDQLIDIESDL